MPLSVAESMRGKKAVIFGLANDRSIAYQIAKQLADRGCELMISYQNETLKKRIVGLADTLGNPSMIEVDVSSDDSMDQGFAQIEKTWGKFFPEVREEEQK